MIDNNNIINTFIVILIDFVHLLNNIPISTSIFVLYKSVFV